MSTSKQLSKVELIALGVHPLTAAQTGSTVYGYTKGGYPLNKNGMPLNENNTNALKR